VGRPGDLLSLRGRLVETLAAFDDGALAALASPGLLARARKDLARERPSAVDEAEDRLLVRVGAETTFLRVPPAESSCSCPAGLICRHVLAALLLLKEASRTAAPAHTALPELLAIDDAALLRYAGKPLLRRAAKSVARGVEATVVAESAVPLVIALPALNVTCRFFPGQGLEGMLCSCAAEAACEHRVAAVLAVQAARGARVVALEEEALEASSGAPRTREEVRTAVRQVLGEAVATGLSRLSRATETRLQTLAVSAHGVDLPRLSRDLDALASEARGLLEKSVTGGPGRFLAAAARVWALAKALERPAPELVGEHRSAYVPVGELVLHGLGGRAFRTPSGFVGLRLIFWDETSRRLAAWTDARPEDTTDFDPVARFTAPGPWTGCPSPEAASRSRFRLRHAQRNARGRLSGREASLYTPLGASDPLSLPPAIADFSALKDAAFALFGSGLAGRRELEDLVLLKTASWGPASFDAVRQELVREVRDAAGRKLALVVPHAPESAATVEAVEKASGKRLTGLLGQLRLWRGRLSVQPVALYEGSTVRCPSLERPGPPAAEAGDEEESGVLDEVPTPTTPVARAVLSLEGALEALAEAGLASGAALPQLLAALERVERLQLTTTAAPARSLARQLAAATRSGRLDLPPLAEELLRAAYHARFAAEAETVRGACAGL